MTLDEMIIELFDNLGRPTDLSPLTRLDDNSTIDPALQGYAQLQNWLNQGYKAITTWRTSSGKFYRSNDMIDRKYIQWGPHTIEGEHTITSDGSEIGWEQDVHVFDFNEDNFYVDNIPPAMVILALTGLGDTLSYEEVAPANLEYQGLDVNLLYQEIYQTTNADWVSLAYFTDAHTLYTLEQLPWTVDETVCEIMERGINWKRFNTIGTLDDLYAIRQLRVIDEKQDMEIAARTTNFTSQLGEFGYPKQYFREGRYLYFDKHVDKAYTLQLEYYRQATPLTEGDQSPVIPERYHTPIVYWATVRGNIRFGDLNEAGAMRQYLETEMKSIVKEDDLDVERYESNFESGY